MKHGCLEPSDFRDNARTESDITVVITSFRRPTKLWEAFCSCQKAGVQNIVLSASGTNDQDQTVHRKITKANPNVMITSEKADHGCNEMWLRGVKMATTKWVHILHDDDLVLPSFGTIDQLLVDYPAEFYHWNGIQHGTKTSILPTFPSLGIGIYDSSILESRLLCRGALSLSPVSGLFQKEHVIESLEECANMSDRDYFVRPGMMVGNDLIIWLRAVERFEKFCYLPQPLISYGNWIGSTTCEDAIHGHRRLPGIYDKIREYYKLNPRVLHD